MAGETAEKQIKEVVEETDRVVGRISKLLRQHQGRGRRVSSTDSFSLWCLRYMEVELSGFSESLKQLPLPHLGPDYFDPRMSDWLGGLTDMAIYIGTELLDNHEQAGATVRCFCSCTRASLPRLAPYQIIEALYWIESPCRYKHLLVAEDEEITSSSLQPQPYTVETDWTRVMPHRPYVGMESALGNKALRWFMDMDDHQHNKQGLKIISMVGPAGVGKTAIAMEVYGRLKTTATATATAKVSQWPDMKKLLLHILSQIHEPAALALPSIDELELELLVHKISQCLKDRRYLIVIDDIWKISDWESIKNAFPPNIQGSRIVMTTRIRSVASGCCPFSSIGLVHEVKSMGELESEMLLSRKSFGCEVNKPPENLRLVCAEILRRCEGIPLFIHGMAEGLQEQHQRVQHMSNYSAKEAPQLLKLFERALSPTYDDLSYKMKLLVLYMSTYPEGYIFEMDTLQLHRRRWRLEIDGLYPDDFDMLFSELIDRNVITPVANWRKGTPQLEEEASQYKLNHFMLQFLASKSKLFLCTSGSLTTVPRSNRNEMLRRISLRRPDPDLEVFLKKMDFFQTRSLAISNTVEGVPLNKFIHLIVLDLEGWQHLKDVDLSLICNSGMLLLQYLSVRNTSVSRLPPEIKKLTVLDTLVASHTQISELPSEVCELRFLHSLDLRSTQIRQLPAHIWKFQGLNTLLVGGGGDGVNCDPTITEVPRDNTDLKTLVSVDLSECSADTIRSLGCLEYLRVVCISWSFHECSDVGVQQGLCSAIERWKYLESLTIHCGPGCRMDFLADSLPNPLCEFLEQFKVTGGRFVRLPPWFQGLWHLASIEITICRLEQGDLWILASLPSLKCLVLGLHFVPEQEIVIGVRGGFPLLGRLSVCCHVPWLTFSEGAMASLAYLELKIGGGNLLWLEDRIPSGLGKLRSLWELVLHYNQVYSNDSNVKTIVHAVRKGVAQHHNPINLVINGIQDEYEYVQEEAGGDVAIIKPSSVKPLPERIGELWSGLRDNLSCMGFNPLKYTPIPFKSLATEQAHSCIPDQNDNLQKAGEDAARATGSQTEIEEIVDAPHPKLYNQATASQVS